MSSIFAQRLRALRGEFDMDQEDLGKRLGMSRSAISSYETEDRNPDIDKLIEIADIFNVSVDYLLGRTNERKVGRDVSPDTIRREVEDLSDKELLQVLDYIKFVKSKVQGELQNKVASR